MLGLLVCSSGIHLSATNRERNGKHRQQVRDCDRAGGGGGASTVVICVDLLDYLHHQPSSRDHDIPRRRIHPGNICEPRTGTDTAYALRLLLQSLGDVALPALSARQLPATMPV